MKLTEYSCSREILNCMLYSQARVNELETSLETYRNRPSIDANPDSSRRRRQSLHDSKRIFADQKYETAGKYIKVYC